MGWLKNVAQKVGGFVKKVAAPVLKKVLPLAVSAFASPLAGAAVAAGLNALSRPKSFADLQGSTIGNSSGNSLVPPIPALVGITDKLKQTTLKLYQGNGMVSKQDSVMLPQKLLQQFYPHVANAKSEDGNEAVYQLAASSGMYNKSEAEYDKGSSWVDVWKSKLFK